MSAPTPFACTTAGMSYNKTTQDLLVEASSIGLSAGHWPEVIQVTSEHTGNVADFLRDDQAAIEHEFWDGVLVEYRCLELRANALKLVVMNT